MNLKLKLTDRGFGWLFSLSISLLCWLIILKLTGCLVLKSTTL